MFNKANLIMLAVVVIGVLLALYIKDYMAKLKAEKALSQATAAAGVVLTDTAAAA